MDRNKSIDGLKYILIVLVVLGHFIEPSRYSNEVICRLYSVIYSFHMPLFVFLSGYFYKWRNIKSEWSKCLPLLEVCAISHIGFALMRDHSLNFMNMLSFGLTPAWYLLSFITWRLFTSVFMHKVGAEKMFLYSIIASIISFVVISKYGGLFSIMRTFQFYPYFMLGFVIKEKNHDIFKHKSVIVMLGLLSFFLILYTSCRFQHLVFFQRDGLLYLARLSEKGLFYTMCYRYIHIISGIFIGAAVYVMFCKNLFIQKFARFGQGTLFIYFGQTLLYPFVIRHFGDIIPSLIAFISTTIVLTYLSTKPISKVLMNPIYTVSTKIKKRHS